MARHHRAEPLIYEIETRDIEEQDVAVIGGKVAREEAVSRFDWDVVAPMVLRTYREVAGGARPAPEATPSPQPARDVLPDAKPVTM